MTKFLKTIICLTAGILLSAGAIYSQDDFDKYIKEQQDAFERYKLQEQNNFNRYRDSVNREYAAYLAKHWEVFKLQKEDPPIKNPVPEPPVYDATAPKPKPEKIPVITPPESLPLSTPAKPLPPMTIPSLPPAKVQPPTEPPAEPLSPSEQRPDKTVTSNFFGTAIALKVFSQHTEHLAGVAEKDIASYWNALNKQPYNEWMNEIRRIKTELHLNDWGMYQLIEKLFTVYFPDGTANEQVVFTVFMLNQLGYRAKTGKNQNELVPLLAFKNKIHYATFFRYGDAGNEIRYSAFNPRHSDMSSIRACSMDYPAATLNIDMDIESMPLLTTSKRTKTLTYKDNSYNISYNKNLVDFYATYPCVEFSVYAEAPSDPETLQSIESQVAPDIRNKSQEEAVNLLLHFVQLYFEYKTDTQQFGYERWYFAEETIASSYSDCEDRSILFAQLVRRILGMKVALVYYPGVHLATAVKFDNPKTDGDYVLLDGEKYLICDPTYRRASLGAAMPKLQGIEVNVIKLKNIK
jgi:hypothetical protein